MTARKGTAPRDKKWVPRHRMQTKESADRQERAIEKVERQAAKRAIESEIRADGDPEDKG